MPTTVLIVDDEPGILTTLSGVLSDEGYATLTTGSGEAALELYRERRPDVVFLDVWLPDLDGLETLQALREFDPTAAVVMMSGHGSKTPSAIAPSSAPGPSIFLPAPGTKRHWRRQQFLARPRF